MTFPQIAAQVWRLARVGGVAALASSQAASKVASGDHKTLIIAGAVAGVEAVYRAAVPVALPVADQSLFEKWYWAVKAVAASPAAAPVEKKLVAEVPTYLLTSAEQAIADAGHTAPTVIAGPTPPT
jgi:hypothetical protein